MVSEDPGNIIITCKDCADRMYINKGNFDIKVGDFVKLRFDEGYGEEYMWVIVKKQNGDLFEGILDNDPVIMTNMKCGDKVIFDKNEVVDRIRN